MKSEIIAADGSVDPKPDDFHPERKFVRSRKYGKLSHKEVLDKIREKRYAREVHSSFFLAVNMPERYKCMCGHIGVFASVRCGRCGRVL